MGTTGSKLIFFMILMAVCVFLGVELAASGLERVYGPLPDAAGASPPTASAGPGPANAGTAAPAAPSGPAAASDAGRRTDAAALEDNPAAPAAADVLDPFAPRSDARSSLINRISFGIGDALRYIAQGVIRFVADVFTAVVH